MKTESGYEITIKVFIPADPRKPGTMEDAMRFIGALGNTTAVLDSLQPLELKNFDADWWMAPPRWIARRKTPAPASPVPAGGTQAQEGTGAVQVSPTQAAPAASLLPNANPDDLLVNDKRPKMSA